MCYSVQVQKDLRKIKEEFQIELDWNDKTEFTRNRQLAQDKDFLKKVLGLKRKPTADFFKEESINNRIWPKQFTSLIVKEKGKYALKHMRFELWPADSKTKPDLELYNARSETIHIKPTWKKVFLKNHALLPFSAFYEQVPFEGKTREIRFNPSQRETMWAPCVYDKWVDTNSGFGFYSFALITCEPNPEVLEKGHDRCPLFLEKGLVEKWLEPEKLNLKAALELLKRKENVFYQSEWSEMIKTTTRSPEDKQLSLLSDDDKRR